MKNTNWNLIIEELNNSFESTESVAKKYQINITTFRYKARKYGVDLQERNRKIRYQTFLDNWSKTKHLLDNTDIPIKEIAEINHITHPVLIEFLTLKGYDIKSRNFRVRSIASTKARAAGPKPTRKLDDEIIRNQHKECLSGDGVSLFAQRFPLNQLHKAFQCVS